MGLIEHSHGGNVAIFAANLLSEEIGRQVDILITIETTVREYQLTEGVLG